MDKTSTVTGEPSDAGTTIERQTVSERILAAVGDRMDTAPEDLHPPLFSAVDPEALEAVVGSLGGDSTAPVGRVEFTYCGYDVTVRADERVIVGDDSSEDA